MDKKFLSSTAALALITGAMLAPVSAQAGDRYHRHHHHHHNDGIVLATDIVNLVGASLNVLRPAPVVVEQPVITVTPAPVVEQPVITVTPAPVVVAPPPRRVVRRPAVPTKVIVIKDYSRH